ncbi:hypothetical protein LTR05_000447 [Lithohypha guttulata]|uniref:Uncharacterized protein n=1 Tax=Lithohypha guttulata TaxID=1690604 RepID=A0AAN7T7E0_9EURO|nr:hypothetical protein LTR05_000447 [Lithohypha guttulata]
MTDNQNQNLGSNKGEKQVKIPNQGEAEVEGSNESGETQTESTRSQSTDARAPDSDPGLEGISTAAVRRLSVTFTRDTINAATPGIHSNTEAYRRRTGQSD